MIVHDRDCLVIDWYSIQSQSRDYNHINSADLSRNPDYVSTFPHHGMAVSSWAEFIPETFPDFPTLID